MRTRKHNVRCGLLLVVLGAASAASANSESSESVGRSDVQQPHQQNQTLKMPAANPVADIQPSRTQHHNWFDRQRGYTQLWLDKTAGQIDDWFGRRDPNKPAKASLRVMMDTTWNKYDGTTVKPRVRGKIKLPTLEQKFSVLIGDETLDVEPKGADGVHNDGRVATANEGDKIFDKKQARQENSSLALRWSKLRKSAGLDVDLGVRSDDVFIRLKAEKAWQMSHDVQGRFEQMYRYGSRSEHTLLSTLEFSRALSPSRQLVNRSHLHYTHRGAENLNWSNSLYQQHDWQATHGKRTFSYGLYVGGSIENKQPHLDIWGPYVSYRQPVLRDWLFVQGDASYYNNKPAERDHYASLFTRLEVVF